MKMLSILDHFVQGCDKNTATLEIIGMLFVFALLGFLLRHVLGSADSKLKSKEEEILNLKLEISQLEDQLKNEAMNTAVFEKKWKDAQNDKEELIRHAQETREAAEREASAKEAALQAEKIKEENERIEKERERLEAERIQQTMQADEPNRDNEATIVENAEEITLEEIAIAQEEESAEELERKRIEAQREQEHLERLERLRIIREQQAKEEVMEVSPLVTHVMEDKKEEIQEEKKTIINKATKKDDLKVIEGVGPAIERWMNENGILSYEEMANYTGDELNAILAKAGPRFRVHDAGTWGEQAKLLAEGKIDEFNKFTAKLIAGKKVKK